MTDLIFAGLDYFFVPVLVGLFAAFIAIYRDLEIALISLFSESELG